MKLFKNEVGRPSNETLRKRRIFYAIVIGGITALLFIGAFALSKINTNNLSGAAAANTLTIKNVTDNSFDIYWTSTKGISTFTIYKSNSAGETNGKIGSKNPSSKQEKSGSWRIGKGGSYSNKITKGNYYLASAKFKDGKIINKLVKVGKATTTATTKKTTTKKIIGNTFTTKSIQSDYFVVSWTSEKGISSITVYNSDKNKKQGTLIGNCNISSSNLSKNGNWRIGEGSCCNDKIIKDKYYLVVANFNDGKKLSIHVKTAVYGNKLSAKNITSNSFDIYWALDAGVSNITIYDYDINSKKQGTMIGSNSPSSKQSNSGSLRVGTGGTAAGKIVSGKHYKVVAKTKDGKTKNLIVKTSSSINNTKLSLSCPANAKVNTVWSCKTNMIGAKITVTSTNLAKGYKSTFTTKSNDLQKKNKYTKKGTVIVTASKSGYTSITRIVIIQ